MGFFSSIGKAFNKVVDVGKDIIGGVVDSVIESPMDAIGTVGNIIGGIAGNNSQTAANEANAALAQQQFEWQKAYAQNRLQWQVEDAKKAGLHPMVAAGLSPTSFSPVSAAQSPIDYDWVGQAGQSLAYAATKAKTNKQQQLAFEYQMELGKEQLNGVRLDNELKMMEIMSSLSRLTQTGPAAPSLTGLTTLMPGQNDSPELVKPEPMRTTPHTETGKEPGSNPAVGWLQNDDGSIVPVMSTEAKQRLEEDLVGTALWNIRNRVAPHVKTMFGQSVQEHTPPKSLLPKGAVRWEYAGYGEYVPVDSKGNRVRPSR